MALLLPELAFLVYCFSMSEDNPEFMHPSMYNRKPESDETKVNKTGRLDTNYPSLKGDLAAIALSTVIAVGIFHTPQIVSHIRETYESIVNGFGAL